MFYANIAIRLGRKLQYDPEKEQFVGDDENVIRTCKTFSLIIMDITLSRFISAPAKRGILSDVNKERRQIKHQTCKL